MGLAASSNELTITWVTESKWARVFVPFGRFEAANIAFRPPTAWACTSTSISRMNAAMIWSGVSVLDAVRPMRLRKTSASALLRRLPLNTNRFGVWLMGNSSASGLAERGGQLSFSASKGSKGWPAATVTSGGFSPGLSSGSSTGLAVRRGSSGAEKSSAPVTFPKPSSIR